MSNPNTAGRDDERKSARKLRGQMGVENQMNGEGVGEAPKVEAVTTPLSNDNIMADLNPLLDKANLSFEKGATGVRAGWIFLGQALAAGKKPFINEGVTGKNGGPSVNLNAYNEWIEGTLPKLRPEFAEKLSNANTRSAAIWLAERWNKADEDIKTGETKPAAKDIEACRKQSHPVHIRDAYTKVMKALKGSPDIDVNTYVPERAPAKANGSRNTGPTAVQALMAYHNEIVKRLQTELLNERLARIHWQGEAARFKSERDDALAQLRSQSVPVNEPEPDVDYIDLDESEYSVTVYGSTPVYSARGQEASPGLRDLILQLAPPKAEPKAKKAKAASKVPAAPKVTKPAKSPRVIKGAAKGTRKGKLTGEAALEAGKAKGAARKAAAQHKADTDDMQPGPSEA